MNTLVYNEYDESASDFLVSTGTTLTLEYIGLDYYFPGDEEKRDVYRFTLTNSKGSYSGKFGDSTHNTNKTKLFLGEYRKDRKNPSSYDILSCLSGYCPDTFSDFCAEYGYDGEPLSKHDEVMTTYLAVKKEANGLRRIFSEDELQQLADIS